MKKTFVSIMLMFLVLGGGLFAENKAGLNKLGGFVGWPPIGLSFSHNFTRVDQIDLLASFVLAPYGIGTAVGFSADIGYLRSVFEPNVGGVVCPLEVGGGIGFAPTWSTYRNVWTEERQTDFYMAMTIFADLRWEVFFAKIPKFNLFVDFAPGIGFYLTNNRYPVFFSLRTGVGLRANL